MIKKIILAAVAVFMFQYFYAGGAANVKVTDNQHDNVILYATSWCGYCKRTRAFFSENNIKYTEYDVEKSEVGRQQYEALGGQGVPVVDIKGTVIFGYSVKKMKTILQEKDLI